MNPNAEQVPVPPQPHRSSFSCDRHPTEKFNGFCPLCLCERLTTLELSSETAAAASSSRRPSNAAAAALKGLFKGPSRNPPPHLQPELLRRTQSFSASKNEGFSGVLEPQRHSCDVRGRSTLWSLLRDDHHDNNTNNNNRKSSASFIDNQIEEESHDEIRACVDEPITIPGFALQEHGSGLARHEFQEDQEQGHEEEVRTIKDHIDLESHPKKPSAMDLKEIAGNFWSAASVFTKKWQKWRQTQKLKKRQHSRRGGGGPTLPVEKPISRQFRETQSEIADYGFGRRSCDSTDPARFSLDVPRMSFDEVRPSFDQPRASWDGHLMGGSRGGTSFSRLPPILSALESSPAAAPVATSDMQIPIARSTFTAAAATAPVARFDMQIPIARPAVFAAATAAPVARSDMQIPVEADGEDIPGGSVQTREYYSNSDSSRRRKSLDRSTSIRRTAAAVVAEMDGKSMPPLFVEHRVSVDSNPNSLRDDCSETFELGFRDNGTVIGERKGSKKPRRWKNIWGLIVRRNGGTKDEYEEERFGRGNGVERSFSSSWQELRNKNVFRSNSTVSWRNSNGTNGKVLERNRSNRFSPNHVDNGLLRFYLTPMRGSCRRGGGGGGMGKSKANNPHSIARSVLRLY